VVGDRKTPQDYRLANGIYLSPAEQERLAPDLSELTGWNCIQRRNLGFVLALDLGAEVIASIDDDNIPYDTWGRNLMIGQTVELKTFHAANGCFDPIGAAGHGHLWHRGYPLQLLRTRDYGEAEVTPVRIDIQADFWDDDPDVDAVCRLEHGPSVEFDPGAFPFASSAVGPFNSQNTLFSREALMSYCVLPGIGRMDDIWAAYHVQSLGFKVAYAAPSVRHERHPHDLTRDMVNEFLGYRRSEELVAAIIGGTYDPAHFWPERTRLAYEAYVKRVRA